MKQITVLDEQNNIGFTFYDNALGTILREFEGFEFAESKVVTEDIAANGGSYAGSKFGRRTVSWIGDLVNGSSSTIFELRRLLGATLRQTGYIKLIKITTYDDLLLQFYADITKLVNPYTNSVHTFLIEAVAPDWRLFSQTLHTQTITSNGTIVNAGNEITEPIFTINGPGTTFTITNTITGESFVISETLIAGQYITVDMNNCTVLLNDIVNIYDKFLGDFFSLAPGNNTLTFAASSGGGVGTNLITSWRDAYRGI